LLLWQILIIEEISTILSSVKYRVEAIGSVQEVGSSIPAKDNYFIW